MAGAVLGGIFNAVVNQSNLSYSWNPNLSSIPSPALQTAPTTSGGSVPTYGGNSGGGVAHTTRAQYAPKFSRSGAVPDATSVGPKHAPSQYIKPEPKYYFEAPEYEKQGHPRSSDYARAIEKKNKAISELMDLQEKGKLSPAGERYLQYLNGRPALDMVFGYEGLFWDIFNFTDL